MSDIESYAENFEQFVSEELPASVAHFDEQDPAIYIYCQRASAELPSRRVLVVTEPVSGQIVVCIEVTYQLFEGDIHHCVRQIGKLEKAEIAEKLQSLAREAYEVVMAWRPTLANIEDYAFLPN